MSNSIPGLLNDTLNLVSLARETALVMGKDSQAKKLTPVVEELRSVVSTSQNPTATTEPTGEMAQSDFQTLLNVAKTSTPSERNIPTLAIGERNMIVKAMAQGNMPDVDIARQLGMTRDEVRLVLNIGKASSPSVEVKK
jgi:hypothetical protein